MKSEERNQLDKEPVNIAEGIFWVGYSDPNAGLHCNPYLIVEGEEAVLIDGGSRDDFSNVMLKILRTGLEPTQIQRLIYQHYDPDLCGSLPQLEAIINHPELKIISHVENNIFIHYYSAKTPKLDFRNLAGHFDFATGRRLTFHATPFCHQPGSFVTYDEKTKTLFSSDLFGSFDTDWSLFLDLGTECKDCEDMDHCVRGLKKCPMLGMKAFHQRVMTSSLAAQHTLDVLEQMDIERILPQHGSIIVGKTNVETVMNHIKAIGEVGIEYVLAEDGR